MAKEYSYVVVTVTRRNREEAKEKGTMNWPTPWIQAQGHQKSKGKPVPNHGLAEGGNVAKWLFKTPSDLATQVAAESDAVKIITEAEANSFLEINIPKKHKNLEQVNDPDRINLIQTKLLAKQQGVKDSNGKVIDLTPEDVAALNPKKTKVRGVVEIPTDVSYFD